MSNQQKQPSRAVVQKGRNKFVFCERLQPKDDTQVKDAREEPEDPCKTVGPQIVWS